MSIPWPNWTREEWEEKLGMRALGDKPGHVFHGNQWTDSTRSTPLEPDDEYPTADGPRWTGPVKESGLAPNWDQKDYDEFTNKYGLGPCAAMSDVLAAQGVGRVAVCNAKGEGDTFSFPHYVVIDKNGAIVDRTNPTGAPLDYYGVQFEHAAPAGEKPYVTADDIMTPDMQTFILEQMARH